MKKKIQLKKSNFIKYLILYFILMMISNFIKTECLVNNLVIESVDVALISGHISSIISSLFIIFLLIIIIVICYFIKEIFFESLNFESVLDSIKTVIITFIIFELFRIALVYFVLFDEIKQIDVNTNIMEQLYNTDWYFVNSKMNLVLIFLGTILFGTEIYSKEHEIFPSITFSIIFMCSFYLVNVDFF